MFFYQAFGISIYSDISLPALAAVTEYTDTENPIIVREGSCPAELMSLSLHNGPNYQINESELLLTIPNIARYYVSRGISIIIEPLCTYWPSIYLYFYSNCLGAILLQRNILTMHVSGVFINPNEVLLLAAPSRTGKSTTALKLAELGYPLFTDDTATLRIINNSCYARASYPMSKLWKETIHQQQIYTESDKQLLHKTDLEKFGFMYHDAFVDAEVIVKGLVFLEEKGDKIKINLISESEKMGLVGINIYRNQWALAMRKQHLIFQFCIDVASSIPAWRACRPDSSDTFDSFAAQIDQQIINGYAVG
ncbi:hypothetical protein [Fibrella forsythiae]|uniref:HPr kinase n=1 Tax=Fibrella forsythiae TaxID=2817061 RepID=A0ABS3JKC0_9BACT|nr:hypothetical protein [Fibrella forsythiae]MBO0949352.1 hypothetical protein [Fibrella forsythiae]